MRKKKEGVKVENQKTHIIGVVQYCGYAQPVG